MKRNCFLGSAARGLSVLFVLVLFAVTAFSQGTSSIRGTIRDPQGNLVSGANVSLTNVGTNTTRTTTSSSEGVYTFETVNVGDYRIDVEASGFKKAVITGVHALINKATPVDVQLEIGAVTESVTVSAGSAELLINREDATLGNNFVNKQILQLPLEARNVPSLLTLQPATTRDGYVAGARSDQANITLDGVDINEAQTNTIIGVDAANSYYPGKRP